MRHEASREAMAIHRLLGLVMLAVAGLPAAGRTGAAETCTDVVHLSGGGELRGAVLGRRDDGGVTVAVRRTWLRDHLSAAIERLVAEDRRLVGLARSDVARRIERRLAAEGAERSPMGDLLRRERTRLEAARDDDAEFALLEPPARQVRRVSPADPAAARLARWGWHEGLDDVESLSAKRLRAALVAAGVDPEAEPPSLADRLPPRPQDDREWHARLALVDDALGTPVALQGVGGTVLRTGGGDAGLADIVRLLPQLLGGGEAAGGLLGDLIAEFDGAAAPGRADRWLEAARAQAPEGRFRATRVRPDIAAGRATVESVFEARLPDGTWATVWRDAATAGGADAPPGAAERIRADPRVAPILAALRGLGVADDRAIDQAIAVGAATLAAQEASDARFAALRSDVLRRLDVPRLDVSAK
jgi:hypothetical protein